MRVAGTLLALFALCVWATDLSAPGAVRGMLAPLAAGLVLIALLLWLVLWAARRGHDLGAGSGRDGASGTVADAIIGHDGGGGGGDAG